MIEGTVPLGQPGQLRPTPDRPILVGLLVDVSGSMMTSIENRRGKSTTRLESFRGRTRGGCEEGCRPVA
jgi:hypothetical protein